MRAGLVGVGLILAIAVAPAAVAGESESQPRVKPFLVRALEIRAVQAMWPISDAEAIAHLELQDDAGDLEGVLRTALPSDFAGLWIDHNPGFGVTVAVREEGVPVAERLAKESPLAAVVTVTSVPFSESDLMATARSIIGSGTRVPRQVEVDVKRNAVLIRVTSSSDAATARAGLGDDGTGVPVFVDVVPALAVPATNSYGGLSLNGALNCTSGFSVRVDEGTTEGLITAAHCSNTLTLNNVNLPFQAADQTGNDDVQWHTTPGLVDKNWVRVNAAGEYRVISSKRSRANQAIGSTVCKYGRRTYYTCGTIVSKGIAPPYVTNANPVFIQFHTAGQIVVDATDSGGPVISLYTALGIVSGFIYLSPTTQDGVYEAEDYAEIALGLSIKTN
jgi:streptogrisin C